MAEHGAFEAGITTADAQTAENYEARRRTYLGFLKLIKWSIVGIAAILIFLVWYAY